MRFVSMKALAFSAMLLAGASTAVLAQPALNQASQWPVYGRSGGGNFSPLTQITPANVDKLKVAWKYNYGLGENERGDAGLDFRFEVQPLLIDGVMYLSTPSSPRVPDLKASITALEPETGKLLWKYESPRNIHGRGIAYWPGDKTTGPRIFFGTDKGYLAALDVKTGKLAAEFGDGGEVDAYAGVAGPDVPARRRDTFTLPNPVSIYQNLVITAARPGEAGPPQPRGDIRAWDARTGKLVWTFHTVPQPGEPNFEYKNDEWKNVSGANAWNVTVVDQKNGLLFAPLGDLNFRAEGRELYANSLVALDAATGKLRWFQQLTHKDLWDWDLPTPPVLVDVRKDGKTIPAVVQTGKQGLVFVFDRLTGKPIHGLEERPTPRSDVAGDLAWPTQPFPTRPGPLTRTSMTREEIPDLAPGQKDYCTKFWDDNKITSPGLYGRPAMNNGTVNFPAPNAGTNWGPGSFNPETGVYVVNIANVGSYRPPGPQRSFFDRSPAPAPSAPAAPGAAAPPATSAPPPPVSSTATPGGALVQSGFQFRVDATTTLPCTPTPWGELVAVDINRGEILWKSTLGITEVLGEKGLATGTRNLGGNIQTASGLIFIGATNDRRFRAFDAKSGKEIWTTVLDASGHSTPISFMGKDGKQYVVVASGGGTAIGGRKMADSLTAFALE